MTAAGYKFAICLSGHEDVRAYALQHPNQVIWVQCGCGSWDRFILDNRENRMFLDFAKGFDHSWWSTEKHDYDIPDEFFENICRHLSTLLKKIKKKADSEGDVVAGFRCNSGRHRSYAMLVMFLMWVSNCHLASVCLKDIAETRNEDLPVGRKCETDWTA